MEKKFFLETKSDVVLAHGVELNEEEKFTKRKTLKQVLTSYVKDEFDLTHFSRQKQNFHAPVLSWTGLADGLGEEELIEDGPKLRGRKP